MKPIRGPAHPVNVPCRRCRVPAGEDCHVIVCGRRCPEREHDNHVRMMQADDQLIDLSEPFDIADAVTPKKRAKRRAKK